MSEHGRTNKQLLKELRSPVARFYPFDLHTHTIGSHDVCVGQYFANLPESLRTAIAAASGEYQLPLAKDPADHQLHDNNVSTPYFVNAFYEALCERRDSLAKTENISDTDNWCVLGVTDHNTSHFATKLSSLAWERRSNDRLIVLPGIELEVHFPIEVDAARCHIHMLCLFEPTISAASIRAAINDARSASTPNWDFGAPIVVTNLPLFVSQLRGHAQYPSACVAAHVWSSKGIAAEPKKVILESIDAKIARLQGEAERARAEQNLSDERNIQSQILTLTTRRSNQDEIELSVLRLMGQCGLDGLQVRDQSHEAYYRRLHRFRDTHGRAVPIVCSDSHTPSSVLQSGNNIPYMKLDVRILSNGAPKDVFDEVRKRALRFGETRTTYSKPGSVSYWIEGIEIVPDASDAREFWAAESPHGGESGAKGRLTLPLSRNLNCFIGGRGSGKSSLIEAIAFLADGSKFSDEGQKKNEGTREDWYRRADATLRGCLVRLVWKTTAMDGIGKLPKRALFVSRYFDPTGRHSEAENRDFDGNAIVDESIAAPRIQLLRAHEIERMAQGDNLRHLFDSLCGDEVARLKSSVDGSRARLSSQRKEIVEICKEIGQLTKEGSALRQYGIRKKLFEAVDKQELRARFQEVDRAELITKTVAEIRLSWEEVGAAVKLAELVKDLTAFFDDALDTVTDDTGNVIEGHEAVYSIIRSDVQPETASNRLKILAAIASARSAVNEGDAALLQAQTDAVAVFQKCRDQLAQDGLPTGSGEREAKKRAFDDAKADYHKYVERISKIGKSFEQ